MDQQVVILDDLKANFTEICRFPNVWDYSTAHFRPCFLPQLASLPALLGTIILLFQALRVLIRWRPRWTQPFVEEDFSEVYPEIEGIRGRWTAKSFGLASLCTGGLIVRTAASILPTHRFAVAFLPVLPWVIAILEILLYRPRRVPYAILGVVVANVIAESILLEHRWFHDTRVIVLSSISIAFGVLSTSLMLTMPYRDPLLPSKDTSTPFTTPTSYLRSPEEALSPWQFMTVRWMTPLLAIGSRRQLEDEDVWSLPHEFQHKYLHHNFRQLKGTVVRRLFTANGPDLVIITLLGLFEQLADYAGPIFLQLILASMRDETKPKRVALTYAGLALCARLLSAQSGVFSLWFGRKCYERSRGEMITMLYEKTLGRKISFQPPEIEKDKNGDANGNGSQRSKEASSSFWGKMISKIARTRAPPIPVKEPASMGKILNLMRNDVYEVAQRFWEFDGIIRKPLAIVFSISLVVAYLGWPSLMAVALVILAQIMNAILARILVYYEKKRRVATDTKLQLISQFVEAIRHLRWYGWQGAWLSKILTARQKELSLRVLANAWNLVVGFINTLSYDLTPVVAFFSYTVIAKKELTVDIAFPALQLFGMMTSQLRELPNLIIALINAWVAVGRIEDFMAEPDRQEMATEALIGDKLALDNASFAWPGSTTPVLEGINISFPEGLTVICGQVAAGKTALLQALLGELDMSEGQLIRPQEPIGYCSQTPWLQSMSIRDNILFDAPHENERYRAVLDACALTPDLAEFKAGDLSLIGENGIGLSGGQRARVALARAVYSRAGILLLDDPLAALDQQTAEAIVRNCITGPLLKGRTTVLITHRTDLVFECADQIVKIQDGKAKILDEEALAAENVLPSQAVKKPEDEEVDEEVKKQKSTTAIPEKFIEDEYRAYGGVKASVYWQYIKAGDLRLWVLTIVILIIYRFFALGETWFLKAWGEAYDRKSSGTSFGTFTEAYGHNGTMDMGVFGLLSPQFANPGDPILHVSQHSGSFLFHELPAPDQNIKPWLVIFLLLCVGQSIFFILSQAVLVLIVYTAAKHMFREVMEKVAGATFRFYDTTPVGRLMNRMTSDIGVIDGGISAQFAAISWMLLSWISAVVVIASITPTFLVFTIILAGLFIMVFRVFIPTSQSLRRLEMVSLTPLMSNFGELLNGLATVRAFNAQSRFQDRVIHVVDTFQKMDHFYWSTQAWLMYRYDILSSMATFILLVLALLTDLSPGLTAFALVSATKFVITTHGLCRQYGRLQMEFVSVERVVELLHLQQEEKGKVAPPAWWPSHGGDIEFEDVTIKYAEHLDPALHQVSFTVKGGSKTAILGRTGSGKSTLALSLLATILPSDGHILIDGIDLAEVDKQLLRTRITFLAQDPVLFPGTMRANLDPVDEHSDSECETVLSRVCARQGWDLTTNIENGGRNLSQGQRQLVGLARAVLRRSAVIILDEATASIDRETADQIQEVLKKELGGSTVITVAHRLEAVRDADFCIVLGKGRVLEQGDAQEMLRSGREAELDD